MQTALEDWIEKEKAPDQIVATRSINGVVDRSRPLCPYPQVALYKGKGDTNDISTFTNVQYTPTVVVAAKPRNGRTPLTPSQANRPAAGSRSPSSRSRKPGMKNSFVSVVSLTRPVAP
jgi:tannase/feruloyl esterase